MPNRKSMLPAAYVCVSVSECVSRHLWLPEFLPWKSAYMHVRVRVVSKRDRVASAHRPKADSRQRKQSGAIALASPISKSMSLFGLAVKPISRVSCAATTRRPEPTTLRSKPGSILMQDVDSLRSAEHRSSGCNKKETSYQRIPRCLISLWITQSMTFGHLVHVTYTGRRVQRRLHTKRRPTDVHSTKLDTVSHQSCCYRCIQLHPPASTCSSDYMQTRRYSWPCSLAHGFWFTPPSNN